MFGCAALKNPGCKFFKQVLAAGVSKLSMSLKTKPKKPKKIKAYLKRNEILRSMGYRSYRSYLKSPLYKGIRKQVFGKYHGKCAICVKKASECHHRRYLRSDLTGSNLNFIIPVCHECHTKIELYPTGKKRSFSSAQSQCRLLLKTKHRYRQ